MQGATMQAVACQAGERKERQHQVMQAAAFQRVAAVATCRSPSQPFAARRTPSQPFAVACRSPSQPATARRNLSPPITAHQLRHLSAPGPPASGASSWAKPGELVGQLNCALSSSPLGTSHRRPSQPVAAQRRPSPSAPLCAAGERSELMGRQLGLTILGISLVFLNFWRPLP